MSRQMFLIVGVSIKGFPSPPRKQTVFNIYTDLDVLKRDVETLKQLPMAENVTSVSYHAVPFDDVLWHEVVYP